MIIIQSTYLVGFRIPYKKYHPPPPPSAASPQRKKKWSECGSRNIFSVHPSLAPPLRRVLVNTSLLPLGWRLAARVELLRSLSFVSASLLFVELPTCYSSLSVDRRWRRCCLIPLYNNMSGFSTTATLFTTTLLLLYADFCPTPDRVCYYSVLYIIILFLVCSLILSWTAV